MSESLTPSRAVASGAIRGSEGAAEDAVLPVKLCKYQVQWTPDPSVGKAVDRSWGASETISNGARQETQRVGRNARVSCGGRLRVGAPWCTDTVGLGARSKDQDSNWLGMSMTGVRMPRRRSRGGRAIWVAMPMRRLEMKRNVVEVRSLW